MPRAPRSRRACVLWSTLAILLACGFVYGGWQLRDYVWRETPGYHFGWDCENGFRWGMRSVEEADLVLGRQLPKSIPGPLGDVFMRKNAAKIRAAHPEQWRVGPIAFLRGYTNLYDKVDDEAQKYNHGAYLLDYSPMRLLTMSVWAWHARSKEPGIQEWREDLNPPLLHMNSVMELLAAAGVFFLVRKWNGTKRSGECAGAQLRRCSCGSIRCSSSMHMSGSSGIAGCCRSLCGRFLPPRANGG